jgi:hemolysin III
MVLDSSQPRYPLGEEVASSVIHGIGLVLSIAGLAVLVAFSAMYGSARAVVASSVFGTTLILLYTASTLYHSIPGEMPKRILRTLDHIAIFLLIAGTYTPLGMVLLHGKDRVLMLGLVWGGAALGILFRVFWLRAPRWIYTPIYLALGWVAIFWMGDIYHAGGAAVVTLIAVGGVLYSMGAVVYGTKRPNPSPRWFGFHEIFHAFTVAAFACHYVAVSIATYRAG